MLTVEPELIGTVEAAELLNISPEGLVKRTRVKGMRPIPFRVGHRWLYDAAEVLAVKRAMDWLQRR